MKKILCGFIILLSLTGSLTATQVSCEKEEAALCEKTYVTSSQIHFSESSFFVEIDGLWIQPAYG